MARMEFTRNRSNYRHSRPPPPLPRPPRSSSLTYAGQNDSLPELSRRYLAIRDLERREDWDNRALSGIGKKNLKATEDKFQREYRSKRLNVQDQDDDSFELPSIDFGNRLSARSMLRAVDKQLEPRPKRMNFQRYHDSYIASNKSASTAPRKIILKDTQTIVSNQSSDLLIVAPSSRIKCCPLRRLFECSKYRTKPAPKSFATPAFLLATPPPARSRPVISSPVSLRRLAAGSSDQSPTQYIRGFNAASNPSPLPLFATTDTPAPIVPVEIKQEAIINRPRPRPKRLMLSNTNTTTSTPAISLYDFPLPPLPFGIHPSHESAISSIEAQSPTPNPKKSVSVMQNWVLIGDLPTGKRNGRTKRRIMHESGGGRLNEWLQEVTGFNSTEDSTKEVLSTVDAKDEAFDDWESIGDASGGRVVSGSGSTSEWNQYIESSIIKSYRQYPIPASRAPCAKRTSIRLKSGSVDMSQLRSIDVLADNKIHVLTDPLPPLPFAAKSCTTRHGRKPTPETFMSTSDSEDDDSEDTKVESHGLEPVLEKAEDTGEEEGYEFTISSREDRELFYWYPISSPSIHSARRQSIKMKRSELVELKTQSRGSTF